MTDSDEKTSKFIRDSNVSPQSRRGSGRGRGGRGSRGGRGKTGGGRGPPRGGGRGLQGKDIVGKASPSDEVRILYILDHVYLPMSGVFSF